MRNILKVIIISTIVTVSLQGWDKFFNWQGSQQRVSCDSDRVSMNYFNDLIIDGEEYYLQDHYETNNGTPVSQYVSLLKKWDKNKEYYSIQVNTLRVYQEYRKNDEDGSGYFSQFTIALTNASNDDVFKTSYTVWYKPNGYWSKETVKLMENKN